MNDGYWNNSRIITYTNSISDTDKMIYAAARCMRNTVQTTYTYGGNTEIGYFKTFNENLYVGFVEITPGELDLFIKSSRPELNDAPYCMFAIPYKRGSDTMSIKYESMGTEEMQTYYVNMTKDVAISTAYAIANGLGSRLYDLQLLPYSPIPHILTNSGYQCDLSGLTEDVDYTLVKRYLSSEVLGAVMWARQSSFSDRLPFTVTYNAENRKELNECYKLRLVSPNFQNMFEFSLAKFNRGTMKNLMLDYTYRPYTPLIRVAPEWSGLYGENQAVDNRGLICGGDFSLAIISDAWTNYQINNKNYSNIFDRTIANMDKTHELNQISQGVQAITGSVQGAALGGFLGGPTGVALGGAASLAGGVADIAVNEAIHKENRDYQTDLYNYNLGNIQAMPDTLTKTSVLDNLFKIFPIIEVYKTTDTEIEILKNKIKYNGMTINAIGRINDYLDFGETFVKGQIIRFEGAAIDDHVGNALYNEFQKGFFASRRQ